MKKYVVAECPYCGYFWHARLVDVAEAERLLNRNPKGAADLVKMCPRGKKRFDGPWSTTEKPKVRIMEFGSHAELREWLRKRNRGA